MTKETFAESEHSVSSLSDSIKKKEGSFLFTHVRVQIKISPGHTYCVSLKNRLLKSTKFSGTLKKLTDFVARENYI